jgi:superfamily I DNA/RNA helicase
MYDELTDLQKTKLNDEQAAILNSKEKYIVVSASPGCGKTFTLVKKIQIDLENQSPNFGIIACSFTREASKQLQDKLGPKTDLSLSFVGTIDSFVLTGIIESFMNRCRLYLLHCKTLIPKEKLLITMPGNFSKANEITRIGTTHPECKTYLHQWLSNFEIGQYEISYCAYVLAVVMIKKMPEVKSFLSARYTGIYVDEAQDMNEFQFELIKALKDECGLKIFLIGDKNQSIYSFRGARPALFSSLVNEGYQNYRISVSVRCEKSIMDFSNRFLDDSYVCPKNQECHVFNHLAVEAEKLNALLSEDVETLWLCRENSKAKELFRYSEKHHFGFVYTRAIDIQDQEFNGTYLRLFEELLKFRMNCTNQIGQFVYSIEDIETVLLDYATEEDVKHLHKSLLNVGKNPFDYRLAWSRGY